VLNLSTMEQVKEKDHVENDTLVYISYGSSYWFNVCQATIFLI